MIANFHAPIRQLLQFPLAVLRCVPGIRLGKRVGKLHKKSSGCAHVRMLFGKVQNKAHSAVGIDYDFIINFYQIKVVGIAVVKGENKGACPRRNVNIVVNDISKRYQAITQVIEALQVSAKLSECAPMIPVPGYNEPSDGNLPELIGLIGQSQIPGLVLARVPVGDLGLLCRDLSLGQGQE